MMKIALALVLFALPLSAQTVCPMPAARTLIAPAIASTASRYELLWDGLGTGSTYELQEAKNPDFTGATTTQLSNTFVYLVKYITTPATYYYRVRGHRQCSGVPVTSPWSEVHAVNVVVPDRCVLGAQWNRPGVVLHAGSQTAINWFRNGCGSHVKIELVNIYDPQASVIHASTPNDGAELWNIPASLHGDYDVRLTDLSSGTQIRERLKIFPANTGPLARGDFNADGRHDLLWRNKDTGQLWVSTVRDGAVYGGFTLQGDPNTAWRVVGGADFNADGRGDYLRGTSKPARCRSNSSPIATRSVLA